MTNDRTTEAKQRQVYKDHYKRLYNTCLRIVGDPMEAEEAMHDAFLKLFAGMENIKDEARFYGWSKSIAVNTAIDRVRKKKIVFETIDPRTLAAPEPLNENDLQLSVNEIKNKLIALPAGYRIIVSMHLFEGYDFEEIAMVLNLKEASVRSQFSRGRKKLVEMLKVDN